MRKILLFLLLSWMIRASAQTDAGLVAPKFGFFAGVEAQLLGAGASRNFQEGDPYIEFQSEALGLTLGGFARFPLLDNLALQPEIGFSYSRHRATLWADHQQTGSLQYTFADLELPLHFVLSNPVGRLPLRSSILFGGRLGMNVALPQPKGGIALLRERVGIDLGLGIEFRLGKWWIHPEVLYSHGLNNLHDDTGSLYDWSVDHVLRDKISLRILVGKAREAPHKN